MCRLIMAPCVYTSDLCDPIVSVVFGALTCANPN